jgi:hypothetical protein
MEEIIQFIKVSVLILPVVVMALTELVKRLPVFPDTPYIVRLLVLFLSVAVVVALGWDNLLENAIVSVGQVILIYTSAIGFYETIKNLLKKI